MSSTSSRTKSPKPAIKYNKSFLPAPFDTKLLMLIVMVIAAALMVFLALFYLNGRFEQITLESIFSWSNTPDAYKNGVVLFYGDQCDHCDSVNHFISVNHIEDKLALIKLEVSHDLTNKNILSDRAQVCGVPSNQIGVPFLWDGKSKKCIIGDADIIAFLKRTIK